jgi:hypothetical protein
MTEDFSNDLIADDLLSGYFDGELSLPERRAVEKCLETDPAKRQLISDFRQLRGELQALPQVHLSNEFTERVVAAAAQAKDRQVRLASRTRRIRRAAGAFALAAAACGLWMLLAPGLRNSARPREPGMAEASLSPLDALLASLRSSLPGENEAVVLRLRLPDNPSANEFFHAALKNAGFPNQSPQESSKNFAALSAAYQSAIENRLKVKAADATAWDAATLAPADAYFIEATLAELEKILSAFYSQPSVACSLFTEARLALQSAEAAGGISAPLASAKAFIHHLDAASFRLEKRKSFEEIAATIAQPNGSGVKHDGPIRVLLLVERFNAP